MPLHVSVASELVRLRDGYGALAVEVKLLRLHLRLAREERAALKAASDIAFARFMSSFRRWAETCRKANFDPNQPRVPAGNPDGGQWTSGGGGGEAIGPPDEPEVLSDVTPDNDWIAGARYAGITRQSRDRADGHHYVPRSVFNKYDMPPEARKVFEDAKTGRLHVVGNRYDGPHRAYNTAVDELFAKHIRENDIDTGRMTVSQARSIVDRVLSADDPRIRNYNMGIKLREYLYRLRSGIRRSE